MKDIRAEALRLFKEETSGHTMEVLRDDGLYRHLKFTNGGSQVYRFDLITWPGYLAVAGDMGEFVFTRVPDMFTFFRNDNVEKINPSYWAEKCMAVDHRTGGLECFYEEKAREGLHHAITSWYDEDPVAAARVIEEAESMINFDDGHVRFLDSCLKFGSNDVFRDYENLPNPMYWSHHYLWICHAIVWGIQQYDRRDQEDDLYALAQQQDQEEAA